MKHGPNMNETNKANHVYKKTKIIIRKIYKTWHWLAGVILEMISYIYTGIKEYENPELAVWWISIHTFTFNPTKFTTMSG